MQQKTKIDQEKRMKLNLLNREIDQSKLKSSQLESSKTNK